MSLRVALAILSGLSVPPLWLHMSHVLCVRPLCSGLPARGLCAGQCAGRLGSRASGAGLHPSGPMALSKAYAWVSISFHVVK